MGSAMVSAMKLALGVILLYAGGVPMTSATFSNFLSEHYYDQTCRNGVSAVTQEVLRFLRNDLSLAPALLRMHFHDCFVRGCDSSVMIFKSDHTAERDGLPNQNSLRGFEVIEAAKAAVERICPGIFSCADIIAQAARDSVVATGGHGWHVQYGRRDGNISLASDANSNLPSPFSDFNTLVKKFLAKGLNEYQMVALSGSHTIGSGSCAIIQKRLYNFTGKGDTDPAYDPAYANLLKTKCKKGDFFTRVQMDPTSNGTFDSAYFSNVQVNKGLFVSDAALITNSFGASIVNQEANVNFLFDVFDFPFAMLAMGNIEVLTGRQGAIRKVCSDPFS